MQHHSVVPHDFNVSSKRANFFNGVSKNWTNSITAKSVKSQCLLADESGAKSNCGAVNRVHFKHEERLFTPPCSLRDHLMNDTQDDSQDPLVRRAAQRYGTVGAMLAGGMVVFDKLLGRKPKQEAAVVFEASSDPIDIDNDGITVELNDHLTVHSPAPSKRVGNSRIVRKRHRAQ
jgi:hypothetical protein